MVAGAGEAAKAKADNKSALARLKIRSKPVRAVLKWQLIATVLLAAVSGYLAGVHGALSAGLGGMVSICAGLASALVVQMSRADSPGDTLIAALRAEGVKVGAVVVLLWLVLATYSNVVVVALIGSFVVSVLVFSMAFFVRDV